MKKRLFIILAAVAYMLLSGFAMATQNDIVNNMDIARNSDKYNATFHRNGFFGVMGSCFAEREYIIIRTYDELEAHIKAIMAHSIMDDAIVPAGYWETPASTWAARR